MTATPDHGPALHYSTAPATAAGASEQFAAWVFAGAPAPDAGARTAEAVWEAASASLLGSMRLRSGT